MYENIEKNIAWVLIKLGISPNMKGYHYLRAIIMLSLSANDSISNFSKELYPKVAVKFGKTAVSVERAVRHTINNGWHRRDRRLADSIFGNSIQSDNDTPTNTLFIAAISEWIKYNYCDGE